MTDTKTITIASDSQATDNFCFFATCSHNDGRDGDHDQVILDIEDDGTVTAAELTRQALADCSSAFGAATIEFEHGLLANINPDDFSPARVNAR